MEFHIPKSSDSQGFQDSFHFDPQDLSDIPCPDDIYPDTEGSPQEEDTELLLPPGTSRDDFPDLPLPPGTSGEDLPIPLPPKKKPSSISNNFSPSLSQNKAHENTSNLLHCESENFNILPLSEGSQQNSDIKSDEFQDDVPNKQNEMLDSSKYSPSKVDSDNENQDFIMIKPKVLGKEQAKKRLMAFSLSKQPSTSIKKPSKALTPGKSKEKSVNPSKGSNVQDQFRATISAIEEEKKKMYQNMPRHLLLEMSELTKSSHSTMSSSMQVLEKLKGKDGDLKSKDNSNKDLDKTTEKKSKRSYCKSRSQSKSKKSRRSRSKRRSQSRSKRGRSRSRRRSYSRSRRSKEKNFKVENKPSKETQPAPKKEYEDWKSFKAAGMFPEGESDSSKNRSDDSKSRRDEHHRRSRSPRDRPEFKPIFSYLTKNKNPMGSLQAKPAEPGSIGPIFVGKTIKYTRTKPILCWAENPSQAMEFYMSRQMLLENCDETTGSILVSIIESKNSTSAGEDRGSETLTTNTRLWFPRDCHFLSSEIKKHDDFKVNESLPFLKDFTEEFLPDAEDKKESDSEHLITGKPSAERKISLVNDSYLSEEEDQMKETIAGDGNARLNIDLNRLKVRSKWDSDYEGENSEKDVHKEEKEKASAAPVSGSQTKHKHIDDFDVAPREETPEESAVRKKSSDLSSSKVPENESLSLNASDINTGNLASEYEEFLKMVSVHSKNDYDNQEEDKIPEPKPKTEKSKLKKIEKSNEEEKKERSPKLGTTDWDQESDREEKAINKKMQYTSTGSHDEFLILGKNEASDVPLDKTKKKPLKKKAEKEKLKKKLFKKIRKTKKKKFEDSVSEDSTSESCESDSDSDSEESDSSKKKKKRKKISKAKKKSKKDSSTESDSESSEDDKSKKKKPLKKKGKKKRSSSSSSSSSDDDKVQAVLLKQFDVKKVMKKVDDIDTINDRSTRKKEKENRGKKKEKDSPEGSDSNKYIKSGKKKKSEGKVEKDKKKSKLMKKGKFAGKGKKLKKRKSSIESESDSESSDESVKKKKTKKSGKRKRYTSDSSDSDVKPSKIKSKSSSKISKKSKKPVRDSSSSASDDSDDSSRGRKKSKKVEKVKNNEEKIRELSFKDDLLLEKPDIKSEERSSWGNKKLWKKPDGKNKKVKEDDDDDDDDWEESSSIEESEQDRRTRESSWDEEEIRWTKAPVAEESATKLEKRNLSTVPEKEITANSTDTSEANNQLSSEALKTSLSNFSFNENSFCSFGQELSRDFFLAERSYSNSGILTGGDSLNPTAINPRPFQSVSKDSEMKKPAESELYSPGCSDSEPEMNKSDDKANSNSNAESGDRDAIYDPLNCDSDNSADNVMEVSNIPLPHVPDLVPAKNFDNIEAASSNSEGSVLKDIPRNETDIPAKLLCGTPPGKFAFTPSDFTPVTTPQSVFSEEKTTPTKRQLMSVKGQQKLISKAASVFQDDSDEENIEPLGGKDRSSENSEISLKEKSEDDNKRIHSWKSPYKDEKDSKKRRKEKSRERSVERESKRKRSKSRERDSKKSSSPRRRESKTPETVKEKREIRSDSFEIEPLKSSIDSSELTGMIQPIPVLTGVETSSSEGFWSRSLVPGCEFPQTTDNLIDHAESFDIYPHEESNFRGDNYDKDYSDRGKSVEKSRDQKSKKERRKSRSRSVSPRKKLRSKSPEKRKKSRSPRRKSVSPKRRDKSPFSPRRRKSPSRKYKSSRSGDKRRKSPSRSPRNRRGSVSWRSRSSSPREESPKHRDESPRRKDSPSSPRDRFSGKKDARYSYHDGVQKRIPVIGTSSEDIELSPSAMGSYESGFSRHMPGSSVTETEMYGSFYGGEYTDEFGVSSYPEDVGVNNLITVKNHDIEEGSSTERLSLDQRIEMELGVQMSGSQAQSDQYQNQVCLQFQEMNSSHFTNSYNCENNTSISNENFYQNQNADFNGQYFNGHQQQPANYGSFQYLNSQPAQNSVLQVGNIVEVVPTTQHPLPAQIMQVGNVLQVVTSPKGSQVPSSNYGLPESSPLVKTQKATAVVAPSSVVPPPNVEAVLNPLIKAIQLEREKRRKEREKRKSEREARRKARQLRREAKLMSVNEKLKKSVQDEGLMLGQEVEDEELLDGLDVPSPPIPVEIITVSSVGTLPPAGKGILITAGFMPKPPSEKKEVKFADGVCPGEGTSTSGGEDIASPPPKPKLPKEKRFKKKKTKVKKKVKVQIIRQIIQEDDDEDDLSPPPPPPGDPPLVFFAKFPFAGDAQFPVYQTQTTTTTLTTIQYPTQTFE